MKKFIFIILFGLYSNIANASDFRFGIAPFYSAFVVQDPEGESASSDEFHLINFITVYDVARDQRIWSEIGIIEFEVSPSVDEVSQDVEQLNLIAAYQYKLRLSRKFKPWVGIGLSVSQSEYKSRFLVDEDGFLAQEFENREETELGLVLQAQYEIDFGKKPYTFVLGVSYLDSFADGVQGTKFNVSFLY